MSNIIEGHSGSVQGALGWGSEGFHFETHWSHSVMSLNKTLYQLHSYNPGRRNKC